jgi:DNA-binding MarR family transcriptional regulator
LRSAQSSDQEGLIRDRCPRVTVLPEPVTVAAGKSPGIAVVAVDRLESARLVIRQRDRADRRHSRVLATPAGHRASGKADSLSSGGLARLLPGPDDRDPAVLRGLLDRGATSS